MEATTLNPVLDLTQPEAVRELTEIQKNQLVIAEKDLEDAKAELGKQKYLVDVSKEDIENLSGYITHDAPWKFTEALGIIEVEKELKECAKKGKLFLSPVAVEAIFYYMSKAEGSGKTVKGTGFKTIDEYLKVLKPLNSVLERIKADQEKVRNAEFRVAALREGINPEEAHLEGTQ